MSFFKVSGRVASAQPGLSAIQDGLGAQGRGCHARHAAGLTVS